MQQMPKMPKVPKLPKINVFRQLNKKILPQNAQK
jgi:hypothetical protein